VAHRPPEDAPDQDPTEPEDGWVSVEEAAAQTGCTQAWLLDRCRDGRLPSRPDAGSDAVVPLATVQALVSGRISD
jgi:hypothetical protein